MGRVFVSHRGPEAVAHAARLHRDLAERLGEEHVVAAGAPEPGDIVLVVVAHGDGLPTPGAEGVSRELSARELEDAVLRDDRVVTVRVVLRVPLGDAPRTWYVVERSWDEDVERIALELAAMSRDSAADEPPWKLPTLDGLLAAEASGAVRRRRAGLPPRPPRRAIYGKPEARRAPPPPPDAALPVLARHRGPLLLYLALGLAAFGGLAAVIIRWLAGVVEPIEAPDDVDVTVFSPTHVAPGDSILIQVFAHLPAQADDAGALAAEFDVDASRRGFAGLALPVANGATLAFELRVPGLELDGHHQALVWRGKPASVQFGAEAPADLRPGTRIGTVIVSLGSVPVGHVKFKLTVEARPPAPAAPTAQPVGEEARRYRRAFVSYAHEDRREVLRRVQVLRLTRLTGLSVFQDLLHVDPGERWRRKLYLEIDRCDVLLLFWSTAARDSEWVRREVAYALGRKVTELDPPEILPVIVEVPPCPPWPELAEQQFDDPFARLISAEE